MLARSSILKRKKSDFRREMKKQEQVGDEEKSRDGQSNNI